MARKSSDDRRAQHSAAAQKAAAAGGTDRRSAPTAGSRILGFPALVVVIMVLGTGLVVFARLDRDAPVRPIQNEDHWHSAYGIWDCAAGEDGAWLDPYQTVTPDPLGIHSHQDSLLHVHPFAEEASGENADLGDFLTTMGVEITPEGLGTDTGVLEAGVMCDGEPAIIQVARWEFAFATDEAPDIFTENFDEIRFRNDGEAWTFARAPRGADIPPPEEALQVLATVNPNLLLPEGFDPAAEQDFLEGVEDDGGSDGGGADEADTGSGDGTDTDG